MPGAETSPQNDTGSRPSLRKMLRRFGRISGAQRFLLLEAIGWLALARIALIAVPFRRLAARFGQVRTPADLDPVGAPLTADQTELTLAVGWAVTRAARYVPFRAVCLPQAIAAKAMLRRRKVASVMHFGVARRPGAIMDAHAWLEASGIEVTGYPMSPDMIEIAKFV